MRKENPAPTLDTRSGVPIYRQIIDWVKVRVASRTLQPGEQLPTVRQLAVDLNVNYNTVARAYLELERMGVVHTLRGKGTFVAEKEVAKDELARTRKRGELVTELLSRAAEFGLSPAEIRDELNERLQAKKEGS